MSSTPTDPPPAPPVEPVEAQRCGRCAGAIEEREVEVHYAAAKVEGVPARVCVKCGDRRFKGPVAKWLEAIDLSARPHHVEPISVYRYGAPPVEVEDEGARPLTVQQAHWNVIQSVMRDLDNGGPIELGPPLAAFERAIREEATAYEQSVSTGIRAHRDSLIASLDIESQLKDEWRTRAEAAEGALRRVVIEIRQFLHEDEPAPIPSEASDGE